MNIAAEKIHYDTQQDPKPAFLGVSSIKAMVHVAPENRLSINDINDSINGPNVAPPLRMIGLKEKRICSQDETVLDLAYQSVDQLVQEGMFSGGSLPLDQVDLIIYYGISREYAEPASAVLIQRRLGIPDAASFDVSNACLGFVDAWGIADAMIASGRVRFALLVGAEHLSNVSKASIEKINQGDDHKRHIAALTLSDGASAALVGPKSPGEKAVSLVAGSRKSFSEYSHLCTMEHVKAPMHTDPAPLFEAALDKFFPMTEMVLNRCEWAIEDIDTFVCHQASIPALKKGANILGVPYEKADVNFSEYGNMASVAVPFTLSRVIHKHELWRSQKILTVGFGSGLGVGVLALQT